MRNDSEKGMKSRDLIIIGSGPAGLSAALYAARADMDPLVLTGMSLHGQASITDIIENYPGFPEGIGGAELGQLFQVQAERFRGAALRRHPSRRWDRDPQARRSQGFLPSGVTS